MFENTTPNSKQTPPAVKPAGGEPEDIFAGVDAQPASPVRTAGMPAAAQPQRGPMQAAGVPMPTQRAALPWLKIVWIVGGLVIVGGVAYAGYLFLSQPSAPQGGDLQGNQNTQDNTVNQPTDTTNLGDDTTGQNAVENPTQGADIVTVTAPVAPVDTDLDGISDEEEVKWGTDPNVVDTDGDGLSDRQEIYFFSSDPLKRDTDGDGYEDGAEVQNGYDPAGPGILLKTF